MSGCGDRVCRRRQQGGGQRRRVGRCSNASRICPFKYVGLIDRCVRLVSKDAGSLLLTVTRATARKNPRSEKYTMNAGRLNKTRRSSREWVGSGTIPNTAISTAPPAMRMVPRIIQAENTSPRRRRAKKAFHSSDTAPRGARMTTGSEAIWNSEPRMFEVMNMPVAEGVSAKQVLRAWITMS